MSECPEGCGWRYDSAAMPWPSPVFIDGETRLPLVWEDGQIRRPRLTDAVDPQKIAIAAHLVREHSERWPARVS